MSQALPEIRGRRGHVVVDELPEIRLYGELGKRFGRSHRLAVGSVREAAQALAVVVPGFGAHLIEHSEPGYRVFIGRPGAAARGEELLDAPVSPRERICIVPVVAGAKKAGLGSIILGAVLIGLTAWNPLGAFAGQFAPFHMAGKIGLGLVLGGAIQMISPQRTASQAAATEQSFAFSGAPGTLRQGGPVPLVYGRVIRRMGAESIVSAGLLTDDMPTGAAAPMPAKPLPAEQPLDPINDGNYWNL